MRIRCNYSKQSEKHNEIKHKGVRYLCDKCEYSTSRASLLKRHIENKHEGVRYNCDNCECAATRASNLKKH